MKIRKKSQYFIHFSPKIYFEKILYSYLKGHTNWTRKFVKHRLKKKKSIRQLEGWNKNP